jgi:hypothetical protein
MCMCFYLQHNFSTPLSLINITYHIQCWVQSQYTEKIYCAIYLFWQYWDLNSGPCACWADPLAVALEPYPQTLSCCSFFSDMVLCFFLGTGLGP